MPEAVSRILLQRKKKKASLPVGEGVRIWGRPCRPKRVLCALLLSGLMTGVSHAAPAQTVTAEKRRLPKSEYELYLQQFPDTKPQREYTVEAADYTAEEIQGEIEIRENYENREGKSVLTPEEGWIEWTADIPEAGLYHIRIEYYPVQGKSTDIERELYINGKLPFQQAAYLTFPRVWTNETEITRDSRNNDVRPSQIEAPRWMNAYVSDYMGYFSEPYSFYLNEGTNTLRLSAVKEPMLIRSITIGQAEDVPAYAERVKEYRGKGYDESKSGLLVEGEHASYKSSPMLYPVYDRSSPATQPYDKSKIRLNTIGGSRWVLPGQWITWTLEVKESGLYQIALKTRQNITRGMYSNRRLTIDGEVPFAEMENLRFKYDSSWQMNLLADEEGEPYLFYLEKGTRELTLEAVLGDLAEPLRIGEDSVYRLNEAYRRILMLTGTAPDQYRDYNIDKELPDVIGIFKEQSKTLESLAGMMREYTGQRGSHNAILERLSLQLKDLAAYPQTIPKRLDAFKSNVGALSQWVLSSREQALEIDYIMVSPPGTELPEPNAGFFAKIVHELKVFAASFYEDYNSIGDIREDAVRVWITSGRDQGQVLKTMIEDSLVPEKKIRANLQIVQSGILLSAIVAGLAPDVALQVPSSDPVNFALRGAVADLSQFPDAEEICKRFYESALVPYRFGGGLYALPEQQVFPMLFYRSDILEELNLPVPETWDEIIDMLPVIQKNHMDIGLPVTESGNTWNGLLTYTMLLYQNGGELYQDGGKSSGMNTETGIETFREWTNFYVNYKFPLTYNVVNRFRTGEVPIAISEYSTYNVLSVFAPELRGLWGMAPLPGIREEDGSVGRATPGNGSGVIMVGNARSKEQAWEFMKWWTGKDMQVRFAREMESLMGAAARYPTANVEAMAELPWRTADYETLSEQWKWVRGIPEVPGGYFTPRHLDNAFRAVVLRGEDPREAILDYTRVVNEEINIKRKEFGLKLKEQ